jgi:hypothetical protein
MTFLYGRNCSFFLSSLLATLDSDIENAVDNFLNWKRKAKDGENDLAKDPNNEEYQRYYDNALKKIIHWREELRNLGVSEAEILDIEFVSESDDSPPPSPPPSAPPSPPPSPPPPITTKTPA